ncbi:MAG: plectin [Ruminococcus sp.]|nr:plectin [Ruminococcus sp.]
MAESRFIKTVDFGGYDRADVIKRLEFVNTQLFDCKNELREAKLLLDEFKKGTDEEKAHEKVLGGEKTKLTSLQVQNESLNQKLKAAEEDNKKLSDELAEVKGQLEKMKAEFEDTTTKLNALQAGSEAVALSQVFIAAQQSAEALKKAAADEASELEKKSRELSESIIQDANSTAAEIVYEAEKKAAETDAESKNKAEKMDAASNNLRANLNEDIDAINEEVSRLRAAFEEFQKKGFEKVKEAEELLSGTKKRLESGGVPTFRVPKNYEPEYPEAPEPRTMPVSGEKKKTNSQLEELQKMANSMKGGDKPEEKAEDKKGKKGGVDLAALAAQAASLGGKDGKNDGKDKDKGNKKGGVDLAALAAQAAALNDKK